MHEFPIIYKKTQTNAIQQWQIVVDDNSFYTIEGQKNGQLTVSKKTIVHGKNVGRANETSAKEQALKEAESRYKKKLDKDYFEDINKINQQKFFAPMLAHKYNDYRNKINFPVLISPKLDGCRMIAQKNGLFTRNGKKYISCPHIEKILQPLFVKHPNWIIDGEVYTHDVSFEKIISLVKKTKPSVDDLEESKKFVQYWIFDGVIDDPNVSFDKRFELIKKEIDNIVGSNKALCFVETIKIDNHQDVEKYHNVFVQKGFEGAMIRVYQASYENKRSKNLLKYKKFFDKEFKIIDIEEGIGNRSGMAGNLILKIGSQFFRSGIRGNDDYYKELLINKKKLIGKLATVRYQNLSDDGIPRFPVAIAIDPVDR